SLHTSVPVTAVIGPGVPLNIVPSITSPSTSNDAAPVERFTRALPPRAVQGNVPALIFPTGLSTFTAVITPAILLQRTSWLSCAYAALATSSASAIRKTFFISILLIGCLQPALTSSIIPAALATLGEGKRLRVTSRCRFGLVSVTWRSRKCSVGSDKTVAARRSQKSEMENQGRTVACVALPYRQGGVVVVANPRAKGNA